MKCCHFLDCTKRSNDNVQKSDAKWQLDAIKCLIQGKEKNILPSELYIKVACLFSKFLIVHVFLIFSLAATTPKSLIYLILYIPIVGY